jgi:hypothetical protein
MLTKVLACAALSAAQAAAPLCAVAQAAPAPAPPAVVPAYRSALADYRAWRADEAPASWRRANDEMEHLQGHAGHLRPAVAPVPARAQSDTPSPKPHHGPMPHHQGMGKKR